ncbi:unnamed protein product [Pieris macdunnoughi]|uniref:Uncharacterized protein n=1 Tax=Pieris macdunnoughi TaxID=345717 RepID=A0A821Y906_9NEOP|nr:unnamed protein product [Pieris macdunnoughi]
MYELEQNVIGHNFTKYRKSKLGNWKITPFGSQKNLNRLPIQSQPKITTQKRAILKSNPSKIEKFQKFFEKNKDLFKEFLSSKIAARTQVSGFFTRGGSTANTKGLRVAKNRKTAQKRGWLDGDESGGGTTEPLDPDRLDMLPAVGGRVHYWRIRGRLCHRHVLMPEGPKYDSKGRVYLPAHTDNVRRPYNVTRRPHLLLPKCCNCCKKSVLGCE